MRRRLASILFLTCCAALPQISPASTTPAIAHSRPSPSRSAAITAKIKANLAKAQLPGLARVHLDTNRHGVVRLTGTVPDKAIASQILAIAQGTEGVEAVRNGMTVRHWERATH